MQAAKVAIFVLFALFAPVSSQRASADEQDPAHNRRITPIVRVVETIGPAVANIQSKAYVANTNPLYSLFHGAGQQSGTLGSGLVIDPDGYVITNAHVVQNAPGGIKISVGTREAVDANVIWQDKGNDLALLKTTAGAPYAYSRLGNADDVMIGETVIALGNPYGYESTVSRGIVSATNRSLRTPTGASFFDFIQTDAALHPGNSGGPLVNINGDIIGINTMVQYGTEAIGFAIPANRVQKILDQRLTNFNHVSGVYLGARVRAGANGGVMIHFVEENSPASKASLEAGDVITLLDEQATSDVFEFNKRMLDKSPGDTADITVLRNGQVRNINLTLDSFSQVPDQVVWQKLGIAVRDRDRYNRRYPGLLVTQVQPDGPADSIGLRRGDLIQRIDDVDITGFEDFYYAATEDTRGWIKVDVVREGMQYEGELTLRPLKTSP